MSLNYECRDCQAVSRRSFLKRGGAGLAALAFGDPLLRLVANSYGQTAGGTGNLLVLCQLNGGMDALSFLAPFTNAAYRTHRPQLALGADDVHVLPDNSDYGINKQFGFFNDLYTQGQCAIVQQVAYPDGNGSHFESQEIYEYGVRNLSGQVSVPWYERLRKSYFDTPYGVLDTDTIGDPRNYGYPDYTYWKAAQEAFGRLAQMKAARENTAAQSAVLSKYNDIDQLGQTIRERAQNFTSTGDARGAFYRAAALAATGLGTQIIKLEYGGFDTHAAQDDANARLFPKLNDEFSQFVADCQQLGIWDRTCVVFYTEFGRRNAENGSPGTDHGHGGHMILCGPRVSGGLRGQPVTTSDLNERNLPYYVDFRAVFSSTIRDWLGFDPAPVFNVSGETFDANTGGALFR